jgi:hypothetical protein
MLPHIGDGGRQLLIQPKARMMNLQIDGFPRVVLAGTYNVLVDFGQWISGSWSFNFPAHPLLMRTSGIFCAPLPPTKQALLLSPE